MEPDEYQEQQDSLNVNEQTWRDGSSGGLSNPMKEEDDPQIKNRVWAAPLTMEKKKKKPDSLPTAKELSERFGASFAPILERFKEQIRFEIEDGTMALKVPYRLRLLGEQLNFLIQNSSNYVNLTLEDIERDLSRRVSLELCRVDIRIKDFEYDNYDNPEGSFEESYQLVKLCRDIDEDGIVANPGFGDEWVKMKLKDDNNNRTLIVSFKVYLQIPII